MDSPRHRHENLAGEPPDPCAQCADAPEKNGFAAEQYRRCYACRDAAADARAERARHETLAGEPRDPWLVASVRAVFCALDRIYSAGARTDALLERANNIVQALCLGTLTIAESERAVWESLGVDNGAGALPVEHRGRAVKAILRAWLEVRPEPREQVGAVEDISRVALRAARDVMINLQQFNPAIGHLPSVRAALLQVRDALGEEVAR
jgi:hypothetical protein